MESFRQWKADVRSAVVELEAVFEDRFGYPADPDANFVSDADLGFQVGEDDALFPPALASFYAEVGEVSLPDVHIGYFIHPAKRLAEAIDWGQPVRVESSISADVATFGSDGGGGFYCVIRDSGAIYYLPSGHIADGLYTGGLENPRHIAPDFQSFLDKLLAVAKEFVATGSTAGV
ncbi:hypothetical protein ACQEUX_33540 [Micromonospora sp. CA-259024]|uniref:hypothetical protein n=1 Tax=Micromonospora sp. CA-259024 TaxID=3239965 RepID=UPI003D934C7E